ncbi:MAG: hypothetical protein EPN88_11350 [Bacteroidetes bacterium]|nr:MAG: hypothetical protein EPN88_11350 [Bacteroidota bacterium]
MAIENKGQGMSPEVEAFNNNAKTLVEFSRIQARRLPIAEIGERFFTLFQERLDACQTKEQFQRLDTDTSYVELYDHQRQNALLKAPTFWERVESELNHRSDEDALRVYGLKKKAMEDFTAKAKPLFQSDLDALVTVDGINQFSDSLGVLLTEALLPDLRRGAKEIIPLELDVLPHRWNFTKN